MFLASNTKIIENRVKKIQEFPKILQFSILNFNLHNNYAYNVSDDIIQLMSKDALIIRLQVLKVSF